MKATQTIKVHRTNGVPITNPQRKAEKQQMGVLGLENRKQLRKYRKKQTKARFTVGD